LLLHHLQNLLQYATYTFTRGPWPATPALIKVDEIGQNYQKYLNAKIFKTGAIFWGRGTMCLSSSSQNSYPKGPFL